MPLHHCGAVRLHAAQTPRPGSRAGPSKMVAGTRHRFALFRTVGAAYRFALHNLGGFLVVAGLPWLALAFLGSLESKASRGGPTPSRDMLLMLAVDIVVLSSFALGWHRFVLTGSATSGISTFRLLFRDLRFLACCILLLVSVPILIIAGTLSFAVGVAVGHFMILVGFVGVALLGWMLSKFAKRPSSVALVLFFMAAGAVMLHQGTPQPVVSTFSAVLVLVLVAPLPRLFLALPAIAMGATGALSTAWHRSEGNGAKLYLGLVACAGPFEILRFGVLLPMSGYAHIARSLTPDAMWALEPFVAAWSLLEVAVVSSFLCFAYRQLGAAAAAPAPPGAVAAEGLPSA
jgi:hypothetical protein